MAPSMTQCPRCHRHVIVDDAACPFCRADMRRVAKVALAAVVAVTTSVALLDCAYGCPAPCGVGPLDDGGTDSGVAADGGDAQATDR
jgi:hypothetical protein